MAIKLVLFAAWMILVPFGIGAAAVQVIQREKAEKRITFLLPAGLLISWAVFQLISVPFILMSGRFETVTCIADSLFLLCSLTGWFMIWKRRHDVMPQIRKRVYQIKSGGMVNGILWVVFLAGIFFQLYKSYTLAYADGDDAYYLPISTAADLGGTMYLLDPYTGAPTTLDVRHGLAPFPIWLAYIAKHCGVNAAVAAHSLLPLVLIPVTYMIYLEIGRILCGQKDKMLPVFMLMVSALQIFGNYSIYPASTFLLTRTRQGKEALGNIVLPFLFLILLRMGQSIAGKKNRKKREILEFVLWIAVISTAGCLCSTMSVFLIGLMTMIIGVLLSVCFRDFYIIPVCLAGCTPGICYALLYFFLR